MRELGFRPYLRPEHQSPVITAFHYPAHPRFRFEEFYARLRARGIIIYPGKVSKADCFRVGTIGRIYPADVEALLEAMGKVLVEMEVTPL